MFLIDSPLLSMQREKFTDESSSLTEQITKLEQLLSSRTNILKVLEHWMIDDSRYVF